MLQRFGLLTLIWTSAPLCAQAAGPTPAPRSAPEVATVRAGETARDAYRRIVRTLPPRSADAHGWLARWCSGHGLVTESRRHVDRALRRDPDHGPTRTLLGQRKVRGRWLDEVEAKRALGFVRHEGRWRLPQEIRYLERARCHRRAVAGDARAPDAHTLSVLHARLLGPSDADRRSARDELVALARAAGDDALARWAAATWRTYEAAWELHRRRRLGDVPVGVLSLSLQKVDLLGIDTVPVGFGVGTPALVQLPRTRSVHIGTTVALPLGTGR